jgi:Spy/CpxP family protein refolding chaperone
VGLNQKNNNMKLNKTTLIAALALGGLLTLNTGVNAQNATTTNAPAAVQRPTPPPLRGRNPSLELLVRQLDLTLEQKTNVQTAMLDLRKKQNSLRMGGQMSMSDFQVKRLALQNDYMAKMKEILTPEQFAKYQKLMPPARRPGLTPPPSVVAPKPMATPPAATNAPTAN